MSTARTNTLNDGREFQAKVMASADLYREKNLLRMDKVDPPVRVVGSGQFRKVLFMENHFLDFIGSWTERAGRMVAIEAKSTAVPSLGIPARLTDRQREWLLRWHNSGAAVGVLWEWKDNGTVFLPIGQIQSVWKTGRRHIKFDECERVAQGQGFLLVDFIQNLRKWYEH